MYKIIYCVCVVFFFKQNTAYEMRISDWSSDVCSSDLDLLGVLNELLDKFSIPSFLQLVLALLVTLPFNVIDDFPHFMLGLLRHEVPQLGFGNLRRYDAVIGIFRSEEHTSELQSLMRISYAVFCLKKKKNIKTPNQQ